MKRDNENQNNNNMATPLSQQQSDLLTNQQYPVSQNPYTPYNNNSPIPYLFPQTTNNNAINPLLIDSIWSNFDKQLNKIQNPLKDLTKGLDNINAITTYKRANIAKTSNQNKQASYYTFINQIATDCNIDITELVTFEDGTNDVDNYIKKIWQQLDNSKEFADSVHKALDAAMLSIEEKYKDDKDIILAAKNFKENIEKILTNPEDQKDKIIKALKNATDSTINTFTSVPGTLFFVLYNIIFRPIAFFYYVYDSILIKNKYTELKNMEKDDPERDNKLNRAAFLLTQITNDGSKNMACLFATKNKQYGKVFGYQINHGISSFQDDIIICKDMSKCLKEDTTNMKNILSLFSLAINNKSQFANKIITTKDKTIKFSWVEIPDPKKPDKTIKEFKSEIVDNDDNLQNDENTFYIKNSNIQDFLKTTTGTNKGVEEDKDFVKDLHGVVDTFTEIMENKNIIEFKKILNNKLNDNDIESFGKSVEEFVTNFENSNKIKDQNLLFVQDAIDYADNIKDYLNKEYSKSNDKITELNNAIAPKYDIILKTLYNSAIEICEEKDGKYSIKKDVSGADDYKDCTRKINDTLTNITKYSNIKDFVNACTQNNKNPLDHIGSNINNISTYKKYSDDIKDIVNAANTKIDIIKRGLEKKLEVLKGENYEEYTENKHDDKVNRQGKRTLTHKFANNPEVFNRHTKEIHYVK